MNSPTPAAKTAKIALETDENCIFCGIVAGTVPARKIYEDDETVAFLNIHPMNLGQTLVIPKDHFENIYSLPDEQLCRVMITTRKIATAIKSSLDADGINIAMNNETASGQAIFHAHIHIIPRYNDDGLGVAFDDSSKYKTYEGDSAGAIVEKIVKEL